MTKYEWESELKKNLHLLPPSEQEKIFEYYNELFQDKIEIGMSESRVIAEFGNPCDVARKIIAEYEQENGVGAYDANGYGKYREAGRSERTFSANTSGQNPPPRSSMQQPPAQAQGQTVYPPRQNTSPQQPCVGGYGAVPAQGPVHKSMAPTSGGKTAGEVILTILGVLGMIFIWVVAIGVIIAGIGMIIGGIVAFGFSFVIISESIEVFLITAGGGIVVLGLGSIIVSFSKALTRLANYWGKSLKQMGRGNRA